MTRRSARTVFVVIVALVLGTLTWGRSPVSLRPSQDFTAEPVEIPAPPEGQESDLQVTGIWDISGSGAGFGGLSALIAMPGDQLRSFSDRGWQITFQLGPDGPGEMTAAQVIPQADLASRLFDIESATTSADGESYWLGYEALHAIHRFTPDDSPDGLRDFRGELRVPLNEGIEAMVRLTDGRFVIFPERGPLGYLMADDPVSGAELEEVPVTWPVAGFKPTDAAQLPDGRVMVLMRRFSMDPLPKFESLIAIGDAPRSGEDWEPEVFANLDDLVPPENYEGLAIRELAGGDAEIYLISDDNFSAFQRTLLVRMVLSTSE